MKRLRHISLIVAGILLTTFSFYNLTYVGKIFPTIFVANINVSGKTITEATQLLKENTKIPQKITLTIGDEVFETNTQNLDLTYDYEKSTVRAFNYVRTNNILYDFYKRIAIAFNKVDLGVNNQLNEDELTKFLDDIDKKVDKEPVYPSAKFIEDQLVINRGEKGKVLDKKLLLTEIEKSLAFFKDEPIKIQLVETDPTLSEKEAQEFQKLAEKYLGKKLILEFVEESRTYNKYTLDQNKILSFLNPKGGFNNEKINDEILKVALNVNREPQEAKFNFESGKVSEFLPSKDGIKVNQEKLNDLIKENLNNILGTDDKTVTIQIPVDKSAPHITTDKVNNLGIKELIGRGTSTYYHSIPGRIYNVALATSRVNGTLVAPGETFSFNSTVGDISAETGYKQAYIIESGRTVLGDGGGVCQVSTTLFRAVMDAGLPISERRAHAYRVGYYEQDRAAGFDATVFNPTTDFKFTNDTGNYILVTAKADSKNLSLVFELYGTSDGRVAKTTKPVITNVSEPPPDIYQDDPTLPAGTLKQVDYKAWGAKSTFYYTVTRGGEEIYQKTFVSNYKPWAAVFLRGTGQ